MNSLKDKVMIVNLTISQWGARKYDATATREVESVYNAHEAGRFNKSLIKSDTLKEISAVANKIRLNHYELTLPWGDNGDRILSTESYFKYISEIGVLTAKFNELVEQFIQEYYELKQEAKFRLNGLYKESDYPHEVDIKDKFKIRTVFMPIADAEDFRLNVSQDVAESIKNQITSEMNGRVAIAIDSVIDRAKDVLTKIVETLSEDGKIFRDSLIGNVESLVETMPLLNFNNDQRINDLAKAMSTIIVNPDPLRYDLRMRKEICNKAKAILDTL